MIDQLRQVYKHSIYILSTFRRCLFKVQKFLFSGESETLLKGDLSDVCHVCLVADDHGEDLGGAGGLDLVKPVKQVVK